jgi:hypothetical protein
MDQDFVLGYVHPEYHAHAITASLDRLWAWDREHGPHFIGSLAALSGPRVATARNIVASQFLNTHWARQPKYLLMVDTDMVFTGEQCYQMITIAEDHNLPILGGLCFGGQIGAQFPTMYRFVDRQGETSTERVETYPENALVKVAATGTGFLLIRRDVLEKMHLKFGRLPSGQVHPMPWFMEGLTAGGHPYGEDVFFCLRANALGIPTHVHTGIKIGHQKTVVLDDVTMAYTKEVAVVDVGPGS